MDFDTLEEKGRELKDIVTLRRHGDALQEHIKISNLLGWLLPLVTWITDMNCPPSASQG